MTTTAPAEENPVQKMIHILEAHYGPSGWWPGETPLEIAVGAILTQNTSWNNVEKAIRNLREADLLELESLHHTDHDTLGALIRPSGYYNMKARRLHAFTSLVVDDFGGSLERLFALPADRLRTVLLAVNGIGPETADSICCYAAGKPVFVVDAYTRRILTRHHLADETWTYEHIQDWFYRHLNPDLQTCKDLHGWIVFTAKDFCRTKNPFCDACPLNAWQR